jgi:hypothetical protein
MFNVVHTLTRWSTKRWEKLSLGLKENHEGFHSELGISQIQGFWDNLPMYICSSASSRTFIHCHSTHSLCPAFPTYHLPWYLPLVAHLKAVLTLASRSLSFSVNRLSPQAGEGAPWVLRDDAKKSFIPEGTCFTCGLTMKIRCMYLILMAFYNSNFYIPSFISLLRLCIVWLNINSIKKWEINLNK